MLVIFSSLQPFAADRARVPNRDFVAGLVLAALLCGCSTQARDDVVSEARRHSERGFALLDQGALEPAREQFEQAELLAARDRDLVERARALGGSGLYHETVRELERALQSYTEAEQCADAAGEPEQTFMARLSRASCLGEMQRFDESLALVQDAMAGASQLSCWYQATGHQSLGLLHYATKKFDLAYSELAQARALFEMAHDPEGAALANLLTAQLLERDQRCKDALNRFSVAKRQYSRMADPDATTACLLGLARCYRQLGEPSIAQIWLNKALALTPPPAAPSRAEVLALAIVIHAELGEQDAAAKARAELNDLERTGPRPLPPRRRRAPPLAPPPKANAGEAWQPVAE
ncbi:MAG: hypothetical protein U1E76_13965 [Planctomycetota bacterium]